MKKLGGFSGRERDGKFTGAQPRTGVEKKRDKRTRENKEKNKERVAMKETPIRSARPMKIKMGYNEETTKRGEKKKRRKEKRGRERERERERRRKRNDATAQMVKKD